MIFVIFTRSQDTLAGLLAGPRARHLAVCATWRSTMATSFHLISLALSEGRTRVAAKERTSVQLREAVTRSASGATFSLRTEKPGLPLFLMESRLAWVISARIGSLLTCSVGQDS